MASGAAAATTSSSLNTLPGARSYAVSVDVTGTVEAALGQLRRKCQEADLQEEIRKRQHHLNPSERKFQSQTESYNRAMGRVIKERIKWLARRRLVKL